MMVGGVTELITHISRSYIYRLDLSSAMTDMAMPSHNQQMPKQCVNEPTQAHRSNPADAEINSLAFQHVKHDAQRRSHTIGMQRMLSNLTRARPTQPANALQMPKQ
jgi:hypothetical protein